MEYWRQCAQWLISCKVLPQKHRVTWETAQIFDLAQTLRDGVLLCQLLNNLRPQSINLKEINLRPQMSQFLCLKNIRTFLNACLEIFAMKKSELFEAFDLFDVRDFGKVLDSLSRLSHTGIAQQTGIRPFPTEESVEDDLEDFIDKELVDDEDGLYGSVYDDAVYENLMRTEAISLPQKQTETDIRSCCVAEIKLTEEKYTETLESIEKYFMTPLRKFLSPAEIEKVFINIPDLVKVHKCLMQDIQDSILYRNAQNLHEIFIFYKERLLMYGVYCSRVEAAIDVLDYMCKEKEAVRLKLEECSKRANNGKFTLRDLLVVPIQRVMKYHLLLQELVKHTHDARDKNNLQMGLGATKDLALYVNEVKRDNETLKEINQYQRSIKNLNHSLRDYGRPKGDGEVRVATVAKRAKQDRHIFLFDGAVIVCKRRGDSYEMKEVIDLNHFKITNNPSTDREDRKWSLGFYLIHHQGQTGFEFYFKTREMKEKWMEQFSTALSNICPENANSNFHEFRMHTFEKTTSCGSCHMLLRGIFYQGYLCAKCGAGAHKECLGRFGCCERSNPDSETLRLQKGFVSKCQMDPGLPKMLAIRKYSGVSNPVCGLPLNRPLLCADLHASWWQGKNLMTGELDLFPSNAAEPFPCVSKPVDNSFKLCSGNSSGFADGFAGTMERRQAESELMNRANSTYLVRLGGREHAEYAISIKFNGEVKHIKILTKEGQFYITENEKFRSISELIEYYKHHSLKEGFWSMDTTLRFPYKNLENTGMHRTNRAKGSLCGLSFATPDDYSFVPPSSAPFWSVFTPKVMGFAIALYDYSSSELWELSLLEGDVVKIYSKSSDKWWRGEANGRVGWFPSAYVEEEDSLGFD